MNEAETVVSYLLGCTRTDLYLGVGGGFTPQTCRQLSSILKRRLKGEPFQYIIGESAFMGLRLQVTPDVLIPRPETELVVETAIKIATRYACRGMSPRILDVGTGSGCIAIALANMLPQAAIDAIDVSDSALAVAAGNARLNGVAVSFLRGDVGAFEPKGRSYDLIVSNPPYVATTDLAELQSEIAYEPRIALDGGGDGCDSYRRLFPWVARHLQEDGFLVIEIGFGQRRTIEDTIAQTHGLALVESVKDYGGITRVLVFQRKNERGKGAYG